MEELQILFIETLKLVLLPEKENNSSYHAAIQEKLEELEGDSYTFLHKDNIKKLHQQGYIPLEVLDSIENIRSRIISLDKSLWNKDDFINQRDWKTIRDIVMDVLKKIE